MSIFARKVNSTSIELQHVYLELTAERDGQNEYQYIDDSMGRGRGEGVSSREKSGKRKGPFEQSRHGGPKEVGGASKAKITAADGARIKRFKGGVGDALHYNIHKYDVHKLYTKNYYVLNETVSDTRNEIETDQIILYIYLKRRTKVRCTS